MKTKFSKSKKRKKTPRKKYPLNTIPSPLKDIMNPFDTKEVVLCENCKKRLTHEKQFHKCTTCSLRRRRSGYFICSSCFSGFPISSKFSHNKNHQFVTIYHKEGCSSPSSSFHHNMSPEKSSPSKPRTLKKKRNKKKKKKKKNGSKKGKLFSNFDDDEFLLLSNVQSSFPVDCFGVILSFVSSCDIFLKFSLLSKHSKYFIEHLNPSCGSNIMFYPKKNIERQKNFNYVFHVNVKSSFRINNQTIQCFPNLMTLRIHSGNRIDDRCFESTPKIKKLKINSSYSFKDNGFKYLKSLEELRITFCKQLFESQNFCDESLWLKNCSKNLRIIYLKRVLWTSDAALSQCVQCEELRIFHNILIRGKFFRKMKKLKILELFCCNKLNVKNFSMLSCFCCCDDDDDGGLEFLSVKRCYGIDSEDILKELGSHYPKKFLFAAEEGFQTCKTCWRTN